jgi:hypothetical protein
MLKLRIKSLLVLSCCATITQISCSKTDEIRHYRVPSQVESHQPVEPHARRRLLGAIIPHGDHTWFFKVTGSPELLAKELETFRSFVQSIRFETDDDSEPEWTLPNGWEQRPPSGMRFATLELGPPEARLELTVTPLPTPPESSTSYAMSNINRWRGQLGLATISSGSLANTVEEVTLEDTTAMLVDMVGHVTTEQMSTGRLSAEIRSGLGNQPVVSSPRLTYVKPDGWSEGTVGGMRKAAFTVADGEKKVEITAVDLPDAAGELLPNVNRWRQQIQLPDISQDDLSLVLKKIKLGKLAGDYVELVGPKDAHPRESILAVMVAHEGRTWFFKLKGDSDLVMREQEQFESFVRSVSLQANESVHHGE